jgi:hypothetical protein
MYSEITSTKNSKLKIRKSFSLLLAQLDYA